MILRKIFTTLAKCAIRDTRTLGSVQGNNLAYVALLIGMQPAAVIFSAVLLGGTDVSRRHCRTAGETAGTSARVLAAFRLGGICAAAIYAAGIRKSTLAMADSGAWRRVNC